MKVKIFGFTWSEFPKGEIINFLKYIEDQNEAEIKNLNVELKKAVSSNSDQKEYHRIIITTALENDLWGGFILTVKNARKFVQTSTTTKGFMISTASNSPNRKFAEINFFVFNPKNGAGLYQSYYSSAKLNTLNFFARSRYRLYLSVAKITKGTLRTAAHLHQNDLKRKIKELRAIHNIEYEFTTMTIPQTNATPASGYIGRARYQLFYQRKFQSDNGLKDEIVSFINNYSDKIKRLFLKGKDSDGHDAYYSIMDDASVFNEYEFDDFSVELDVDAGKVISLKDNKNIIDLIELTNQDSVSDFFYKEVKEE